MYFEDFKLGLKLTSPVRSITVDELDEFLHLTGLLNPIFMSDQGAREVGHEGRILPGPLLLGVAMGLAQQAGWFERVIAVLEFENLRFMQTVHPGQSVYLSAEVVRKHRSKRQGRGVVILGYELKNADRRAVMTSRAVYLMRSRD
jgi:acyl dehydratase